MRYTLHNSLNLEHFAQCGERSKLHNEPRATNKVQDKYSDKLNRSFQLSVESNVVFGFTLIRSLNGSNRHFLNHRGKTKINRSFQNSLFVIGFVITLVLALRHSFQNRSILPSGPQHGKKQTNCHPR